MFIMFFIKYQRYYDLGVRQRDKGYYLSFLDLEKVSRKIGAGLVMFMIGSFALTFIEGFIETLAKGCIFSALVYPPIYLHYSDTTKYRFEIVKGD